MDIEVYNHIRSGGAGFIEMPRGLIAVWGKEAVQFLDGMITNDMKTLEDGQEMLAAFPNAKGRLLAVVRILRQGERFLIETEEATHASVFQNLFRFTYAGDFFVEDLSETHKYFEIIGLAETSALSQEGVITFRGRGGSLGIFLQNDTDRESLPFNDAVEIPSDIYETLRIESGIPLYGVDMDETTIVPEIGIDDMISYNKGCYIGQEIIARIYFRGHVAKRLTGIISGAETRPVGSVLQTGDELTTPDGKNAGRITSVTFSPKLDKQIALAFVRYDYLAEGTELIANDNSVTVKDLPFVNNY